MDLYTRGLLLAGFLAVMIAIAGAILAAGLLAQRASASSDAFDVGRSSMPRWLAALTRGKPSRVPRAPSRPPADQPGRIRPAAVRLDPARTGSPLHGSGPHGEAGLPGARFGGGPADTSEEW